MANKTPTQNNEEENNRNYYDTRNSGTVRPETIREPERAERPGFLSVDESDSQGAARPEVFGGPE